jgi:hypothetical protein
MTRRAPLGVKVLTLSAILVTVTDARAGDSDEAVAAKRMPAFYYYAPYRSVVFHSSAPAELQRYVYDRWTPICSAPCSVGVWVGAAYRVGGDDATNSREFAVPEGSSTMTLKADVGSAGARTLGVILISGGALVAAAGMLLQLPMPHSVSGDGDQTARTTGYGLIISGAAIAGIGAALVISSRTNLSFGPSAPVGTGPRIRLGKSVEIMTEGLKF